LTNALGIAAVSAVLRDLLNNGLVDASVGDVTVSAQAPDRIDTENGDLTQLNLFLYRVTTNLGWRSVGLPSVDGAGASRLTNPPLALDLHYLLTAYGSNDFEAEILLGYAMQVMHENPVLDREAIRDSFAVPPVTGGILPPALQTLTAAELADQVEQIKIIAEELSSEELSKLWAAFGAHYRPTAGYLASVVLIEGRRATRPALPVRERRLHVVPFREPRIEEVQAADGPGVPIVATSALVVLGKRLQRDPMEVRVSGALAPIVDSADARLEVTLPAGLRAGVQSVQVKHLYDFGTPTEPHRGVESNVAAFVLQPTFGGLALDPTPAGTAPYTGEATVTVSPAVGRAQRVVLLLNRDSAATPSAYSFEAPARATAADPIVVPLVDVARGDYFVRVQVDGAASPLDLEPSSPTFGPKVTI
jgi:hypothetical protein